ncbi:c2 domain-containing protein [Anaeramoeba ignava]|uniref:C2 domain-containing protein n=1 Tax=Anaeramoeba ignava TaxID=1746090 RepID=A0A9Q0RA99_ANAIG|nr:c2 domain-containing protein [Anaeramoeba ignava]
MALFFHVKLANFKGHNLLATDRNGKSDPYLKVNFDNNKHYKTKTIKKNLNPIWDDFEAEFDYDTVKPDRLAQKVLKVECYDHDRFGSDDKMGSHSIDLWSLATGPSHIDHLLREKGKPVGRLEYDVFMENYSEITIGLKNISTQILIGHYENNSADAFIEYFFSNKQENIQKSVVKRAQQNPEWDTVPEIIFQTTLKEIVSGTILISLKHSVRGGEDILLGDCEIFLKSILKPPFEKVMKYDIEEDLFSEGQKRATMKAELCYKHGVSGGAMLMENLPTPKDYPQKGMGGPPKVQKSKTAFMARPFSKMNHIGAKITLPVNQPTETTGQTQDTQDTQTQDTQTQETSNATVKPIVTPPINRPMNQTVDQSINQRLNSPLNQRGNNPLNPNFNRKFQPVLAPPQPTLQNSFVTQSPNSFQGSPLQNFANKSFNSLKQGLSQAFGGMNISQQNQYPQQKSIWKSISTTKSIWKSISTKKSIWKSISSTKPIWKSISSTKSIWKSIFSTKSIWKSIFSKSIWKSIWKSIFSKSIWKPIWKSIFSKSFTAYSYFSYC